MTRLLIAKAWENTLHQLSLGWFKGDQKKEQTKSTLNAIIYDCEIVRMIGGTDEWQDPDLEYCNGWDDHENMGISVIGCYDYVEDRYRVFLKDNLYEFQTLAKQREAIIGFNSINFDDVLCAANGLGISTTYDLLCEVRIASGQPPHYVKGRTRGGYSLERLAQANLGYGKSGSGELAPKLWQQGDIGAVVDYCLSDVAITKKLFDNRTDLIDPTNGERLVCRKDLFTKQQEADRKDMDDQIPF